MVKNILTSLKFVFIDKKIKKYLYVQLGAILILLTLIIVLISNIRIEKLILNSGISYNNIDIDSESGKTIYLLLYKIQMSGIILLFFAIFNSLIGIIYIQSLLKKSSASLLFTRPITRSQFIIGIFSCELILIFIGALILNSGVLITFGIFYKVWLFKKGLITFLAIIISFVLITFLLLEIGVLFLSLTNNLYFAFLTPLFISLVNSTLLNRMVIVGENSFNTSHPILIVFYIISAPNFSNLKYLIQILNNQLTIVNITTVLSSFIAIFFYMILSLLIIKKRDF